MAITNASRIADFSSGIGTVGAAIQIDNVNQRVGIGVTFPQTTLQVAGIVSATSFTGNLTGTATGLTGSPNITVGNITGTGATFSNNLNVGTGITFTAAGINVTGIVTANQFIKVGGASSQFLKADGSVDSTTYATSASSTSTGKAIAMSMIFGG